MAISECYCLLNSSICANDISRLAPPRPIKIFILLFCWFFFFFFFPQCNDRWSAHKTSRHHVWNPQAPSQVWSNWSPSRLPPSPRFGSFMSIFWSLGCFALCSLCKWASDCGNISHWSPGQEWKIIKSVQLSSLMRYSHGPGVSTAQYFYGVKSICAQKGRCCVRFSSCRCIGYVSALALFLWIAFPLAESPV